MEQLKAMYPVCSLIKSDGIRCGSPALTGMNFCFQHIGGKVPKPKPETRRTNAPLNFIYPSNHEAIQHNLFLVVQALSEGKIDNATAITYDRLFRSAQLNLHRWQVTKSKLNQDEVEQQMMPCAPEPVLTLPTGPEETPDSALNDQSAGAPHLEEMWEDAASGLDEPSVFSAPSVMKNEDETPIELHAERRSPSPDQPKEFKSFLTGGEEHYLIRRDEKTEFCIVHDLDA